MYATRYELPRFQEITEFSKEMGVACFNIACTLR
jgi:hypothetical protein